MEVGVVMESSTEVERGPQTLESSLLKGERILKFDSHDDVGFNFDPRDELQVVDSYDLRNENLCDQSVPQFESLKSRLSRKMHERKSQQKQLLQAYHRLKDKHTPEYILISGPSGSGKTHLAKSLQEAVVADGGLLLMGKFDQLRRPEPYRAFVSVFTDFANSIAQDPQMLPATRSAILEAVGEGAILLTDMVPALGRIIGHRDRTTPMNKGGAISSFVFVFRMFVKAVCNPQHPIVFVLEDMQWADPCSLDLLTSLLTDVESKGAVFIGTCEENIPPDSPLSTTLRKLEDAYNVTITNIQVGNFTKEEVNEIILQELKLPKDQSHELSDIIFAQTQGNHFYVSEFVQWLEDARLLRFDMTSMKWKWDKQEISLTISCGCVGDFLIDKIEQLPRNAQDVLKVASCLGNVLDEELLQLISSFEVRGMMDVCAQHGLLATDSQRQTFIFAHDVIQQAAYSMIPVEARNAFHLMIGRKILQRSDEERLEQVIFTVVSQFCLSSDLIQDRDEREIVAGLCLHAGRNAARCSTFRTASTYLNFGIQLLGSKCWREYYLLSLDLYNAAAEMELCIGNFDRMDLLLEAIFQNVHNFRDKLQAYATRIYALGSRDQQQLAITEGKEVLEQLGEAFPKRLSKAYLLREVVHIKALLRGKSDATLLRLPRMEDPNKLAAIQILDLMFLSSLLAKPEFVPFVVLKTMKVTLQEGLSPWTANVFATFGMMCCTMGNFDEAFRFGQLALILLERSQRREFLPRVYAAVYGCIHCWKRPISEVLEPLWHAHRVGLETGDLEFSFLNANIHCFSLIEAGEPLPRAEKSVNSYCDLMVARKQEAALMRANMFRQTLRYFMGHSLDDPLFLCGDIMNFGDAIDHAIATSNATLKTEILFERTLLSYIFNEFDLAYELADQWRDQILRMPAGAGVFIASFFDGLVVLAFARRHKGNQRKQLRIVDSHIKRFKKWSRDSPHNCADKLFLLEAERASVFGPGKAAYEKYVCANALAAESGCLWSQALANERASEHLCGQGEVGLAKSFLCRACDLWEQWGAYAKAHQLKAQIEVASAT